MFPEKTERKSSTAVAAKTIAFEMTKFGYPGQSGVSQTIRTGCGELLGTGQDGVFAGQPPVIRAMRPPKFESGSQFWRQRNKSTEEFATDEKSVSQPQ